MTKEERRQLMLNKLVEFFDSVQVFAVMLALIVNLFFGMLFTLHQRDELKEEAVKRGFAEWVVSSNGTVKWAWKEVAK